MRLAHKRKDIVQRGHDVAASTPMQRQLAAILNADVQGDSRLIGEHEPAPMQTRTVYRGVISGLIQHHRGRVVEAPDDTLLAVFGSAVEAVHCAVAVQQALQQRNAPMPPHRQVHWRIGLHVGEVMVEEDRLSGDDVTIAARLRGLADEGGICLSGTVYDHVEGPLPLTYEALGEQTVTPSARPVRVYRLRPAPSAAPARWPAATAAGRRSGAPRREGTTQDAQRPLASGPLPPLLVGREAELAHLHHVFEKAERGERQIVFVTGEPGIGKTALVNAFGDSIRVRQDVVITSGQCVEQYGAGDAYLPLLDAAQRLCRAPGGERIIAALRTHAPTWLSQMPGVLTVAECEALQRRVPGVTRERMLREMADALEAHTTTRGLIVVLEDLHWSDTATLEWLAYTARRREPAKVLILGTYRPTEVRASVHPLRGVVQELQARGQCEAIGLVPLAEEAVHTYLTRRFATATLSTDLAHAVHRRTGGNPLFVVTLVDYLAQQKVVVDEGGTWRVRQAKIAAAAEGIPESLRPFIERQVERLSDDEQRVLEAASMVGAEFTVAEAAAGLQSDLETLESQCERLARTGQFLRAEGVAEWPDGTLSGRYSFRHAVYREVIAARVGERRRLQWHRRIATRKEAAYGEGAREIAAELAVHFLEGRDDHKAVHYLREAGRNAVRRSAHQEAVAHFTRGLDVLATFPDTPERRCHELALQVALGVPLVRTKGYAAPEVARAYGRGWELCQQTGERPELFTALAGLCTFYLVRAELPTARELAEQCLRLAQHVQDPALLVVAHFVLGVTLFYSGELTDARVVLERGSAFYDPRTQGALTVVYGQDPEVGCRSYASLASWLLGHPEQALGKSHAALSLARELSHTFSVVTALYTAAWLRQYRQEARAGRAYAEEETAVAEAEGFALWLAAGTVQRGWALSEQGETAQGLALMREGLAALHATGAKLSQPYYLGLLAQAYGKSGQSAQGLALLDQALAAVETTGERYYEAELYRLRGELMLAGGGVDHSPGPGAQSLTEEGARGREPETSLHAPHAPGLTPLVPRGVAREAEACFLKAVDIARRQHAKSLELRAAVSLARLWQRHENAAAARELLANVYIWFTEGFETTDLQTAASLLTALGGKVARTAGVQRAGDEAGHQATEAQARPTAQVKPPASPALPVSLPRRQLAVSAPGTSPAPAAPASSAPMAETFRCEGDYWTLAFDGQVCRIRDMRGLHYLADLLQHPNDAMHALRLITGDGADADAQPRGARLPAADARPLSASDSGAVLDAQARAAYKQRITALQAELDSARTWHDQGRIDALREELDFLTHELAQAVGLGGRARRIGSPAERARTTVTKAIKNALKKIHAHHTPLGQYLMRTIKTGTCCAYTPDPRSSVSWRF
jgi:class 3 adenylate cyclase/predicted ATPase